MSVTALSQEFRATVGGHVMDPTGAAVAKAHVVLTNTATGVANATDTDVNGAYQVLFLDPGHYTLKVTAPGFKELVRSEFELRVADRVSMDLTLQMGAVSELVNVTESQPLLSTEDADNGDVIDSRRFRDLPIQDGNAINLSHTGKGVTWSGSFGAFNRPFDSIGSSTFKVEGAPGQNEFTINGLPDMSLQLTVAYTPPTDAVEEVKIQNDGYNAQTNGSAGTLNIALKSGTNRFHGTAYEFSRNTYFNANDFFRNKAGLLRSPVHYNRFGGSIGGPVVFPHLYNGHNKTFFFFGLEEYRFSLLDNFGSNFTVPTCPDRGFAAGSSPSRCGAALGYIDLTDIVAAQNKGNPNPATPYLYDPFTGVASGTTVKRSTLKCLGLPLPAGASGTPCVAGTPYQIDLARISPIAQAYLKFVPLPNLSGVASNLVPGPTDKGPYNNEIVRADHVISNKQKLFSSFLRGHWLEDRSGWTVRVNDVQPDGQNFLRSNIGGQIGDTYIFSPNLVLDFRVGFERFVENSLPTSLGKVDASTMGFTAATASQLNFSRWKYLPTLNINSYLADTSGSDTGTYFGGSLGKNVGAPTTFNTFTAEPTLTWIKGSHTMQIGWDFRNIRYNSSGPGDVIGHYTIEGEFATANSNTLGSQVIGSAYEQFLLGLLSGLDFSGATVTSNQTQTISYIDRNGAGTLSRENINAWFFQDNIRVTPKLNVNAGVRYFLESPFTERFNRNIRGFDFTDPNPFYGNRTTVLAKYATFYNAGKIPGVSPAAFALPGGLCFAGVANAPGCGRDRGWWNSDKGYLAPRLGAAYQLMRKTVLRGGWGLFVVPYIYAGGNSYSDGRNQTGFSLATPVDVTDNFGVSFNGPGGPGTCKGSPMVPGSCWAAPFQGVAIPNPPNTTLGLSTFDGNSLGTIVPVKRNHPLAQHWSVDVQRELPGQWLIDVGYFATHGSNLLATRTLDTIPRQYLTTSNTNDNGTRATINFLNQNVPNPFQGQCNPTYTPGLALCNNATVQLNQLLVPYPQYAGLSVEQYNGSSDYESLQIGFQKRMSHGLTVLGGYTWSKWLEQVSYLNDTDPNPEKRPNIADVPHQITASWIWELPFGHGRAVGSGWPTVVQQLLGGWQVTGVFRKQSGFPINIGNNYFNGNLRALTTSYSSAKVTAGTPVFDIRPFYIGGVVNPSDNNHISLSDNIRTLPSQVTWFRAQGLNNWDVSLIKTISFKERASMQLRCEAFNAMNHVLFSAPNLTPTSTSFGKVTGASNAPRYLSLGAKLIF